MPLAGCSYIVVVDYCRVSSVVEVVHCRGSTAYPVSTKGAYSGYAALGVNSVFHASLYPFEIVHFPRSEDLAMET